ncbi:choriogenin Hminor [Ophiocordyceps camponoti-floridani]|uniref:Choriogenin Hminor n=1 Tax=Ophiocordyceps camponoti-floridani TaxID=2030778 RepID=A0A8H4Q0J5_9HYPO|nr:choriogenin Hminor [Ophiocordyceps camponoti-floridani]
MVASAPLWRWEGSGERSVRWDEVQTDVWFPSGNCAVHLDDRVRSRSRSRTRPAPTFRLPLQVLFTTGCHALIERFGVLDGRPLRSAAEALDYTRLNTTCTVDIFIPDQDNDDAVSHMLAIRNLLSWAVGAPLVGGKLGESLVALRESMRRYRHLSDPECGRDVVDYLAARGMLAVANRPQRAVALLVFAEAARMAGLYREVFAHCVGMSERLGGSPEYENLTPESKSLISRARTAMDTRLSRSSAKLSTFLDEDLDPSHLGISSAIRAHLDRFRSFLLAFYSAKLGYYPPRTFDAAVYRSMGRDFASLYHHLRDGAFCRFDDVMPSAAVGGICVLQLVQNIDGRNLFEPLRNPLPLLPRRESPPRRVSWLARLGGTRAADHRRSDHAALVRATNGSDDGSHGRRDHTNDLVKAYRHFEEDSVLSPPHLQRPRRHERVSAADARKVRWILIYAVHQTLRSATRRPHGIRDDPDARYLLIADAVPPWERAPDGPDTPRTSRTATEIKPDIDYLAQSRQPSTPRAPPLPRSASFGGRKPSTSSSSPSLTKALMLERSKSFNRVLNRNSTIRKSVRKLRRNPSWSTSTLPPSPSKPLYHEILVDGYGNGTIDSPIQWASRSCSTASQSSSAFTTTATSPVASSAATSLIADAVSEPVLPKRRRWSQPDVVSPRGPAVSMSVTKTNSLSRRPVSVALEGFYHEGRSKLAGGIALFHGVESKPLPTHHSLPNVIDEEPRVVTRDSADWTAMQVFLDASANVLPPWEQYVELGGLTELR